MLLKLINLYDKESEVHMCSPIAVTFSNIIVKQNGIKKRNCQSRDVSFPTGAQRKFKMSWNQLKQLMKYKS